MSENRIDDGGPAFPVDGICFIDAETGRQRDPYSGYGWLQPPNAGMSLRDYFAAEAMGAMIGTATTPCLGGLDDSELRTAKAAYKMAAAMLKARQES